MPTLTIYKRELKSYFTQPIAYAIIIVFLLASMALTFTFGNFIGIGDASLRGSFFFFHPWIFMLLVPAVGMRLWSDEQRNGTIELLGTFPVTTWNAIFGKFLAAITVWLVALLLTFPIVITVNYLGKPDNGAILAGYVGSLLVCGTFLAVTMLVSAFTRDQVICLIVAVFTCTVMVLCGYEEFIREMRKAVHPTLIEALTALSIWDQAESLYRGFLSLQDFVWFGTVTGSCLLGTSAILSARRA
ncbi:MAG: ABC transporter permease [Akkermansiaceae bacterium]|nr:ABC transporter permease [Akkermansiaceae bacterium]